MLSITIWGQLRADLLPADERGGAVDRLVAEDAGFVLGAVVPPPNGASGAVQAGHEDPVGDAVHHWLQGRRDVQQGRVVFAFSWR